MIVNSSTGHSAEAHKRRCTVVKWHLSFPTHWKKFTRSVNGYVVSQFLLLSHHCYPLNTNCVKLCGKHKYMEKSLSLNWWKTNNARVFCSTFSHHTTQCLLAFGFMFWLVSEKFCSYFVKCFHRRCNHFWQCTNCKRFQKDCLKLLLVWMGLSSILSL
jgi:hypothetical protein